MIEPQQAKIYKNYEKSMLKLLKTKAAIWFNNMEHNNLKIFIIIVLPVVDLKIISRMYLIINRPTCPAL